MRTTLDITGEIAVVTGGTGGIGRETATELARRGARVIITGRDQARARKAARAIAAETGGSVDYAIADLSTIGGNQDLADELMARLDHVDILVNNVGGMFAAREETEDGIEATLATNVVGPFVLTNALVPFLRRSSRPRVINVGSSAHKLFRHGFEDPESADGYVGFKAYSRSKYYNLLWSYGLSRRLRSNGIKVNAVDPGPARTAMTEAMEPTMTPWYWRPFWPLLGAAMNQNTPADAAKSTIAAATSLEGALLSGEYFDSRGQVVDTQGAKRDVKTQDRVWALVEELVGRESISMALAA